MDTIMEDKYIQKVREQHPDLFKEVLTPEQIWKMEKKDVIEAICKHHPSYGVDKGWSWYIGGMADTGNWHPDKMHYMTIHNPDELYRFLVKLEQDKQRGNKANIQNLAEYYRRQELPEEEQSALYAEDRKKEMDALHDIMKDTEHHLMWGTKPKK